MAEKELLSYPLRPCAQCHISHTDVDIASEDFNADHHLGNLQSAASGKGCPVEGHRDEWAIFHLSMWHAIIPLHIAMFRTRVSEPCVPQHGVLVVDLPFTKHGSRFFMSLVGQTIVTILACQGASDLLRHCWTEARYIREQATAREHGRQETEMIASLDFLSYRFPRHQCEHLNVK